MTTTTHPVIRSITAYPTAEQRREALLELADLVDTELRHSPNSQPLTNVLRLIVPPLCAAQVAADTDVALGFFVELCDAVRERSRFVADEAAYCADHDWDFSIAAMDERLLSNVDCWADRLLGRAS